MPRRPADDSKNTDWQPKSSTSVSPKREILSHENDDRNQVSDGGGGGGDSNTSQEQASSGGSNSTGGGSDSQAQSSDTHETTAKGLGGDPQFWYDTTTKQYFAVYFLEDQDPPIPIMWAVPDVETLKAFGGGSMPKISKKMTTKEMDSAGAIIFGSTDNLPDSELDPLNGFMERMDRAMETQPWLQDPEVLALYAAAYIEGRALQDWELDQTEWFRSRNTEQRKWAALIMSDPKTAQQQLEADQLKVSSMFDSIGATGNDPALIAWMAKQYTMGNWTQEKLAVQVEAVTSGWNEVDQELVDWMGSNEVTASATIDKSEDVRAAYLRWLGPAYPASEEEVTQWATRLRNDPSAEESLQASLRNSRKALYSMYEDENMTYEDIASPWRGVVSNVWGQTADETSDTFQEIIRMNNYTDANKLLRKQGLRDNIGKVWGDATAASSGNMRRAL
ncbi:MAG: hypothetical protein DRQ39_00845 [Gammaproteobacteria bacterium]|nr:MAG: hypothetical protein DRQ39_00845 [Gammaproteobacteria bacterium]RKZ96178.1 MAG: hypothetical protein DRQ40_01710 [Gammaproteobacteria bacterium]